MNNTYKVICLLSLPSLFLLTYHFDLQAYLYLQVISFSILGYFNKDLTKTSIPYCGLMAIYLGITSFYRPNPILSLSILGVLTIFANSIVLLLYHFLFKSKWAKKLWTISLTSFLMSILSTFIGMRIIETNYVTQFKFITTAIVYLVSGTLLVKYSPNYKRDYWYLTLPMLVLVGGLTIPFGRFGSIPIILLPFIAVHTGKVLYQSKINQWISIPSYLFVIVILSFYGVGNYDSWITRKTYTKQAFENNFKVNSIVDSSIVDLNNTNGKVLILDFWTTSCGVCFKKFAELEEVHKKYCTNPNVKVLAVNLPLKHRGQLEADSILINTAQHHIYDKGYTFPVFKADSSFSYYKEILDIHGVPQIFVLNQKSEIEYKGFLHTSSFIKIDNIYTIIDDLISKKQ